MFGIVRAFGQAGFVDPTFDAGAGGRGDSRIGAVLPVADGKTLVASLYTTFNGQAVPPLVRLNRDGSLDSTFIGLSDKDLNFNARLNTLKQQPDGKILLAGTGTLLRLNADGTRDLGFTNVFGRPETVFSTAEVFGLAVQSDGKIIAGFSDSLRLSPSGLPADSDTFITGIARFNADGTFDPTFDIGTGVVTSGNHTKVSCVAVDSLGGILLGGTFDSINGTPTATLARLLANGTVDQTFTKNPFAIVNSMAFRPDGNVLVTGSKPPANAGGYPFNFFPAVLGVDGQPVGSGVFKSERLDFDTSCNAVVMPDGRILLGGKFDTYGTNVASGLVRLLPNGKFDPTFIPTSQNGEIGPMALDANGDLIVAGSFTQIGGMARHGIARILTHPAPQPVAWYRAEGNFADAMLLNPASSQTGVTFVPGAVGQAFSLAGPG